MKTFVKGGPWKNVEDEVLKAAVMKYGKNQWDRIASLISGKTAKQCKARWHEWLDPSIKKSEWTREEEEKLLHLCKIMPTQWRTIAPIVGRTAFQCMEHFEELLDKYQEKSEEEDEKQEGKQVRRKEDDPRRLKSGEVDINAEHRPALLDAIDMDESEKEMLSEARARMVNTLGKKEKRKAREKQLEDRRKLSMLKKRREMKAAGIIVHEDRSSKRKKEKLLENKVNVLKEIPYERVAPTGYHDTTEEKERSKELEEELGVNRNLKELEGLTKMEREELEKRNGKKKDITAKILAKEINKELGLLEDDLESERESVVLPKAMINDSDIKEISEIGGDLSLLEQNARSNVTEMKTGQTALQIKTRLTTSQNQVLPTFTTKTFDEKLSDEAKIIRQLTTSQTPLVIGGSGVDINLLKQPQTPSQAPSQTPTNNQENSKKNLFQGKKGRFSNLPKPKN